MSEAMMTITMASFGLVALSISLLAGLKGWQGWLEVKRMELAGPVRRERADGLIGGPVPETDRAAGVGRGERRAVGAERHLDDDARRHREDRYQPAGLRVPQSDGAVLARGGQELAVRAVRQPVDDVGVGVERQPRPDARRFGHRRGQVLPQRPTSPATQVSADR